MNKTIEKPFFEAFEALDGPVHNCLSYMDETYNLGIYPRERDARPKWVKYFNEVLPQKIQEQTKAFDDTVIEYRESPLIEEIEGNLQEFVTPDAKERYLFTLLKPFKALADKLTPIAQIARLEDRIKELQKDLKMWQTQPKDEILYNVAGQPCGTPNEQIQACIDLIQKRQQEIERAKEISTKYRNLLGLVEDGAKWMQENTVEACLSDFASVAYKFANRLDALLLTYGIDLLRLQKESGIYLKECRCITDVDYYIGSPELAKKYIDALPKTGNGQPQREAPELPKKLNTDKAKGIINRAVEAGYIVVEGGQYIWNGEKVLLAYFAMKLTAFLNLKKNYNASACWRPFESLFGVENLRGAKADYEKYHSEFTPTGYSGIDKLLNTSTGLK